MVWISLGAMSISGHDLRAGTAENYRVFAAEAHGRSALYAELATAVADDPLVLTFLDKPTLHIHWLSQSFRRNPLSSSFAVGAGSAPEPASCPSGASNLMSCVRKTETETRSAVSVILTHCKSES